MATSAKIVNKNYASVAQWIEHRTSNPQVVGSTPTQGALEKMNDNFLAGID